MHLPQYFTRSIEVSLDDLPGEEGRGEFLRKAANQIRLRAARQIRIQGDRLEFLGPFELFSSAYNLLTPITSGWIELHVSGGAITIRYRLSFRRVLWFLMAVPVLVVPLCIAKSVPMTIVLPAVAFGWFWMLMENVVFRLWYFGRLMSKVVDSLWR
jgi:hypothetical protein